MEEPSDPFDTLLHLEEDYLQEGREEGINAGRQLGLKEGAELGNIKGFEVGSELGFYNGVCTVLLMIMEKENPDEFQGRLGKAVQGLAQDVRNFPKKNLIDEDLVHKLQRMRARFKVITSLLGIHLQFNPKEVEATRNHAF